MRVGFAADDVSRGTESYPQPFYYPSLFSLEPANGAINQASSVVLLIFIEVFPIKGHGIVFGLISFTFCSLYTLECKNLKQSDWVPLLK